jgi:hypothetical protein
VTWAVCIDFPVKQYKTSKGAQMSALFSAVEQSILGRRISASFFAANRQKFPMEKTYYIAM